MAVNVLGGALEFDASINTANFDAQIRQIEQSIQGLTRSAQSEARAVENIGRSATVALATYASLSSGTDFIRDIIKVRGEFQKTQIAFESILGSKEKADRLFAQATELAAKTPFSLQDVAAGSKQLLAYGFAAEDITKTLTMLGNVASGVGTDLSGLVYLYGTLRTSGRVTIIDLQQFAGRGVPIFEELSKQLGVSVKEIRNLVSEGKIGFPQVEKAFKSLTGTGGIFFNLMEKQSKSLSGLVSNLGDAWDRMLNSIGESNEGIFGDAIKGATYLVENYQDVLDIIKTLIIAYGSYRAAIIVSNVATAASASIVKVYTVSTRELAVAQTLQATATQVAQRASALLNATLLANPAALAVAGITLLIGTLTFLRNSQYDVKTSTELLNEAQKNATDTFAKQEAEIKQYVAILQDQNIAENVRLEAYQKLKELAPKIIGDLTFQAAKTSDLTDATNVYIASLRQRIMLESKQAAYAEALKAREEKFKQAQPFIGKDGKANDGGFLDILNPFSNSSIQSSEGEMAIEAYQKAADVVIDLQNDITTSLGGTKDAIRFQIQSLEDQNKVLNKTSKAYKDNFDQIQSLKKTLAQPDAVKKTEVSIRNEAFLKAEIDRLQGLRAPFAVASKEYKDYSDQIKKLQAELNPEKAAKAYQAVEDKTNQILEQRTDLLREIAEIRAGSNKVANTREETELDRINKKYADLLVKVEDYNKKAKQNGVQQIGLVDIAAINQAKAVELSATLQKQQAERYKEGIEIQKKIFDDFENYKLQVGIDKANAVYKAQTDGFENYVDFLKKELAQLSLDTSVGGEVKKQFLTKEIGTAEKDYAIKQTAEQAKAFADAIKLSTNYEDARLQIFEKYGKLRQALEKQQTSFTEAEYKGRMDALTSARQQEEAALDQSLITESRLFKAAGDAVITLTRNQIKERIRLLKESLKTGTFIDANGQQQFITPEFGRQIQQGIDGLQNLLDETTPVSKSIEEIIKKGPGLAGAFTGLADSVQGINAGLSDSLRFIGGMVSGLTQAAGQYKQFKAAAAANDPLGQVTAGLGLVSTAVSVVQSIVNTIKASADSKRAAKEQIAAFQTQLITGEIDYNALIRERMRLQTGSNELTLKAIASQQALLNQQRQSIAAESEGLLKKLQAEQFIESQSTRNTGGSGALGVVGAILGFGRRTEVQNQLSSLAGKTFEEIERLYKNGQLTDKAKALFEQLNRIKQEGADIDALLEENRRKADQVFTGTTADAISKQIADGLRKGYRSVQDFADGMKNLIQDAILSGFEAKVIEEKMAEFYKSFAEAAQSNGGLDSAEIQALKALYETKLQDILNQFDQIEAVTGQSFTGGSNTNSTAGAIRGITEQQAELLAGQFGGFRLAQLDTLRIAQQALVLHQQIENNTARTVNELVAQNRLLIDVTNGVKAFKFY